MHTVPAPSFLDNTPSVADQQEARGSFGHPADELTDADHAFLESIYAHELTDAEMDELFCEEMERRDAERAAARKPEIIRCIEAAGRKFKAAVEVNGKKHRLGTFRTERQADGAIDAYIRALHAGEVAA